MWTKCLVQLAETSERTDESGGDAQMKARRALKQGYEDAHSLDVLSQSSTAVGPPIDGLFPDSSGSSVANRKRRKLTYAATTECSNDNRPGDVSPVDVAHRQSLLVGGGLEGAFESDEAFACRARAVRAGQDGTRDGESGRKRKSKTRDAKSDENAATLLTLTRMFKTACLAVNPSADGAWEIEAMRTEAVPIHGSDPNVSNKSKMHFSECVTEVPIEATVAS